MTNVMTPFNLKNILRTKDGGSGPWTSDHGSGLNFFKKILRHCKFFALVFRGVLLHELFVFCQIYEFPSSSHDLSLAYHKIHRRTTLRTLQKRSYPQQTIHLTNTAPKIRINMGCCLFNRFGFDSKALSRQFLRIFNAEPWCGYLNAVLLFNTTNTTIAAMITLNMSR